MPFALLLVFPAANRKRFYCRPRIITIINLLYYYKTRFLQSGGCLDKLSAASYFALKCTHSMNLTLSAGLTVFPTWYSQKFLPIPVIRSFRSFPFAPRPVRYAHPATEHVPLQNLARASAGYQ